MSLMESVSTNKLEVVVKTLDASNNKAILEMIAFEEKMWRHITTEKERAEEAEKIASGKILVSVVYSGDQIVGIGSMLVESDPESSVSIKKRLPKESSYAYGVAIDLAFRGRKLQKILLEKRIEMARQLNKKTIIGSVRPENGASLRNIINTGGRILIYSPDFFSNEENRARLVWEIDTTLPKETQEFTEEKDTQFPDIVVNVKSGEEVDTEAQKKIAQILSGDYVGVNVKILDKDDEGIPTDNTIVFRHFSNFSPEVAERLRGRKEKVKKILV